MRRTHRLIRCFISSTFSDMVREREIIQSVVVPKLKKYCKSYGWQFEVVDLRWGISKEASAQHRTMRICINELKHCQNMSPKPNFVVMVGQRYGWIPLPELICVSDASKILSIADNTELMLFHQRYFLNENYSPETVYEIRSDTDLCTDIQQIDEQIRLLLNRYAEQSGDSNFYQKYCTSATHQEITEGIFRMTGAGQHIVYYDRTLTDCPKEVLSEFIDSVSNRELVSLKKDIARVVAPEHTLKMTTDYSHYMSDGFETEFAEAMINRLQAVIDEEIRSNNHLEGYYEDTMIQQAFIDSVESEFVGREGEIEFLESFVSSENNDRICIIQSQYGFGKTHMLAHFTRILGEDDCIHYFIGKSPCTSSGLEIIKLLLTRLGIYFKTYESYQDLARKAADALRQLDRQVVLIIDGLDQLRHSDIFLDMTWLPFPIPSHVKLILSWSGKIVGLSAILSKYSAKKQIILPLSKTEFISAMKVKLLAENRRLSYNQFKKAEIIFEECGCNPIAVKFLCVITRNWKSTDVPSLYVHSLQELVNLYIRHLNFPENNDPEFVFLLLGMLCFSCKGVTEDEILHIAALDKRYFERLAEQSFHKLVPVKDEAGRIPYAIWSKCYYDLSVFLKEQKNGSHITYCFGNSQIKSLFMTAFNLLYGNSDTIYELMEEYFEKDNAFLSARTVEELPFLYLSHHRQDKLVGILCDSEFIQAKCKFGYVDELYDNIVDCLNSFPDMDSDKIQRLELLCSFLRQQRSSIIKYSNFGNDVKKRLQKFFEEDAKQAYNEHVPTLLWSLYDTNTLASTVKSSFALVCSYPRGDSSFCYSFCSIYDIKTNRCIKSIDIPLSIHEYKDGYSTGSPVLSCLNSEGTVAFIFDDKGVLWKWDVPHNSLISYQIENVVDLFADDDDKIWMITDEAFYSINDNLVKIHDNNLPSGNFAKLYKCKRNGLMYIMSDRRYFYEYDAVSGRIWHRELTVKGDLRILSFHHENGIVWYRNAESKAVFSESVLSQDAPYTHWGFNGFVFGGYLADSGDLFIYTSDRTWGIYDLANDICLTSPKKCDQILKIGPTGLQNQFYAVAENNLTIWQL